MEAIVARLDMPAERCGAAAFDRRHYPALDAAHMGAVHRPISVTVMAKDVRHLQPRVHRRDLRRSTNFVRSTLRASLSPMSANSSYLMGEPKTRPDSLL
jgi:hypothetical protein